MNLQPSEPAVYHGVCGGGCMDSTIERISTDTCTCTSPMQAFCSQPLLAVNPFNVYNSTFMVQCNISIVILVNLLHLYIDVIPPDLFHGTRRIIHRWSSMYCVCFTCIKVLY